jgi:hypothetical protein
MIVSQTQIVLSAKVFDHRVGDDNAEFVFNRILNICGSHRSIVLEDSLHKTFQLIREFSLKAIRVFKDCSI